MKNYFCLLPLLIISVGCRTITKRSEIYTEILKAEIDSVGDEIRKCFEDFLKENNTRANYKIVFEWTIDEHGAARNLVTVDSTFPSNEVEVCIGNIIRNIAFSKPKEGTQPVRKTFVFEVEGNTD